MNNIAKFLFFISSYIPLLVIMVINSKFEFKSLEKGFNSSFFVVVITLALIIISIFLLVWVLQDRKVVNRKIEILKIENKTSESLSYILPYIVSFYQVDFSNFNNVIIFLIMFFTIFAVYVNSNLIAINPMLAVFGYKIFIIESKRDQKIFVISKRDILLNDKEIRAKPVCCNIYLEKGVSSDF